MGFYTVCVGTQRCVKGKDEIRVLLWVINAAQACCVKAPRLNFDLRLLENQSACFKFQS